MNKWSNDEIDIINKFYPLYGSDYCSTLIKRKPSAISAKAGKMNLKFGGIKYKYSKENLIPIIKSSNSRREVIDKLHLKAAGGNYNVINKYIKLYQIDVSHFNDANTSRIENLKLYTLNNRIPLSDVLKENINYNRNSLKKRLYEEKYLYPICSLCGQDENWNGVKISLILDHINGINNDNRIENLRIVCPNCNAGLETFAGKNCKKIT